MADNESENEFASAESDSENPQKGHETEITPDSSTRSERQSTSAQEGTEVTMSSVTNPSGGTDIKPQTTSVQERDFTTGELTTSTKFEPQNVSNEVPQTEPHSSSTQSESSIQKPKEKSEAESISESLQSETSSIVPSQTESQPTKTQPKASTHEESQETQQATSSWGWGWSGLSNVWSTSVSAVTESAQLLSKGLGTVVSGVEETLGVSSPSSGVESVPSSQEMSRTGEEESGKDEQKDEKEDEVNVLKEEVGDQSSPKQDTPTSGLGGFFSGFASAVQSTGMTLVTGGLDALEVIGRKTVDIISEGDPGLRKKRAMISGSTSTLSQLLREAKETAKEKQSTEDETATESVLKLNYSILFDEYGGLVHLEALELLSKECANKLETDLSGYTGDELLAIKELIESLCQYFNVEDDEELEEEAEGTLVEIRVLLKDYGERIKIEKLLKASEQARNKVTVVTTKPGLHEQIKTDQDDDKVEGEDSRDGAIGTDSTTSQSEALYETGLHALAELCSLSIQLLRKISEVTLLPEISQLDMKEQAEKLHRVTNIISVEFESLASLFAEKITGESSDEADPKITSLYLEASNSSSYLQSAFKLVLPILQLKMLQTISSQETKDSC